MTSAREPLPIEGTPSVSQDGWSVRLPVREEEITLTRQTVVIERVRLQRKRVAEVAHVDARLRREQLRTSESGRVDVHESACGNG